PLKDGVLLEDILRRPEMTLALLAAYQEKDFSRQIALALETEAKLSGYLGRQADEIDRVKKAEDDIIPADFSYDDVPSLRTEVKEKLRKHRPYSIGQALRIPGVTPSAISVLAIHLKKFKAQQAA